MDPIYIYIYIYIHVAAELELSLYDGIRARRDGHVVSIQPMGRGYYATMVVAQVLTVAQFHRSVLINTFPLPFQPKKKTLDTVASIDTRS